MNCIIIHCFYYESEATRQIQNARKSLWKASSYAERRIWSDLQVWHCQIISIEMFFCLGCLNCNLHLLDYKLLQQKNQYFVKYYNCFFNNETILRLNRHATSSFLCYCVWNKNLKMYRKNHKKTKRLFTSYCCSINLQLLSISWFMLFWWTSNSLYFTP